MEPTAKVIRPRRVFGRLRCQLGGDGTAILELTKEGLCVRWKHGRVWKRLALKDVAWAVLQEGQRL